MQGRFGRGRRFPIMAVARRIARAEVGQRAGLAAEHDAGLRSVVMATKQDLHHLVDELPDASVEPAARWLARAKDPMVAVLDAAPIDDEPLSDDERTAIVEARARLSRGDGVPLEDLPAEGAPGG